MSDDKVRICSIDIGYRNFCFCIEEFDKTAILNIKNVEKSKRYNADGTTTEQFGEVIRQICINSENIICKNTDITGESIKTLTPEVFHKLTDFLDDHVHLWDTCSAFVIEQQQSFRGVYNVSALKLGQHCFSYFAFKYGRFKQIIEFPAYHKTCVLGAQRIQKKTKTGKISYKTVDKPTRKKWAISKAMSILTEREDFTTLSYISSCRKKDDLCDCILEGIAFVYLAFVDKSI